MAETGGSRSAQKWTSMQAYMMAVLCLAVGFAVGYLLHGSAGGGSAAPVAAEQQMGAPATAPGAAAGQPQQPTAEQLKAEADRRAAPLLAKLKSNPKDVSALRQVGNLYYDAKVFPTAIEYYQKVLAIDPHSSPVRTDMATAMFFTGDIDHSIAEFDIALKDDPRNGNALFNRGIVKWQGKMDIDGALADWHKLLKENPNYQNAAQVRKYIEEAEKHRNIKPGQKTDKPAM